MKGMCRRKRIAPHIAYVRSTNGEQEIGFRNGSRILFGAREQGFGRGFAEVDIEVFDEAQILTERALEDMVAATNQAKHPAGALLFYMGTPPRVIDAGDAFRAKRAKALDGKSKDTVYVELSADPDANPDDRAQWVKANPSYPVRTPDESMLRLRENVGSDESFLREGLGVWDEQAGNSDLDLSNWPLLEDPTSSTEKVDAFAVEVSFDRKFTAIAAAGDGPHDRLHLEIVEHRAGTAWVLERCIDLNENHGPVTFVIDERGPAAFLIPSLIDASLTVGEANTDDIVEATANFIDGVERKRFIHGPQGEITTAIAGARSRSIGDGRFAFGRKASGRDISPLVAVALAAWGAQRYGHPEDSVW